jgi:DNA recombination protein RmuC
VPDPQSLLPFVFVLFAVMAAGLALFIWLDGRRIEAALRDTLAKLAALEASAGGAERAVREEVGRSRTEAEDRASRLRFELGQAVSGSGDSLQLRLGDLSRSLEERLTAFDAGQAGAAQSLKIEMAEGLRAAAGTVKDATEQLGTHQRERLDAVKVSTDELALRLERQQQDWGDRMNQALAAMAAQIAGLMDVTEKRLEALRETIGANLETLRHGNEAKLEQMRATVEEKLQGTLETRIGESFKLVSERLESVHKGLGEMQTLATGVGDLKRVLTNVKSRGGWAEVQLGALLENMLSPEQFVRNARIKPGSAEMVEFAVQMPGAEEGRRVLLPIDAKFPHEDYERLMRAQERGDAEEVEAASLALAGAIRREAKRIADKYIDPPATTDFAILYLPTEGLFAEAIRRDELLTDIQQKFKVTLAGPTTLAAYLTALQMGFRTMAVQKRSSEVWRVLGEAKAEFDKYGLVWDKLRKHLETAQRTVEEAGTRTKAVARKLRSVEALEPAGIAETPVLDQALLDWEEDANTPGGGVPVAKGA